MSRILAALCFSVLLSGPAIAQTPADDSLEKCHANGLQATSRDWQEDAEEDALIKATHGKVARFRNILSLRPAANFKQAFVDNWPDELPCDFLPHIETYPETYRFKGLYGDVAAVLFNGYEYPAYFLVDMITGARLRVDGENLLASGDGRFLLLDQSIYAIDAAPFRIFDTKGALRIASLKDHRIVTMAWDGPRTLKLSVQRPYRKDPVDAVVTLNDIGIKVVFPTEHRTLTATFAPITLHEDLPFGPPSEEQK